jgi:hypothetical protein
MTFLADANTYQICFYHSMACYFIMGHGRHNMDAKKKYMFPFLASLKGQAATTISNYLKDLRDKIDGMPQDVAGTSIRIGATNMMVNMPYLELVHAVIRGGWEYTGT